MMRSIVGWGMKFHLVVLALAVAMVFVGIAQLSTTSVDALPEFAPPYVQVQTEAPGLSASEVEELVTFRLEELLNGLPFVQSIRSSSVPGLSSITLIFQPGTDLIRVRQLVSERVSLAYTLPNVSQPPVILQPQSATSRVMMVGLSSNRVSAIDMGVLARFTIRPALLSVPGVANVAIWGIRDHQLQVLVDPHQLQAHHVTLDQIVATTGNALEVSPLSFLNASSPGNGGFLEGPQQRFEVRHVSPISSPSDLAQVSVEGTNLHLSDVANVVEDHQSLIGDDIIDNGPGMLIVIDKFPGANTLEVTRGIEAKLNELKPGLSGIQVDSTIFRPTSFVEQMIYNPSRALLIGFLLLGLLLLALLYHWRVALISLVTIPLSLIVAGLVLSLLGATINIMVLAGLVIAVGILVDDAIVDVENIVQRLRQQRSQGSDRSSASIILEASLHTRGAMTYATMIILLALLPLFLLQGVSAAFLEPLALAYTAALLASMLVALIVTPVLCLLLLSKVPLEHCESPLLRGLQRGYSAVLGWVIRILRPGLLASAACVIGAMALVGLSLLPSLGIGSSLLPSLKEPDVVVQWEGPPGTSQQEMLRITTLASRELHSIPGIHNVAVDTGRAILGDQIVDVDSAELTVSLDSAANYDATVASIQNVVNGYPGMFHIVQTYLSQKINQVLKGTNGDIVVRIYGSDQTILLSKAEEVRQSLSQIKGAVDVHTQIKPQQPQVDVEVNLAAAQHFGLTPGDVRREVSTLVTGLEAGSLFQDQKIYAVVVWGTPQTRSSLSSIRDLLIDTPNGGQVRLGDVASVSIQPTSNLIQHDLVSRFVDVSLNVHGRDAAAVANEVQQRLQGIQFPLEYHAEVLGQYQDQQVNQEHLLIFGIVAALGILLLLQTAFGSWRLASLAFVTLPSALVGGVLAAFAVGSVVSFAALLGLLAVFGIATRNGIMLINHYQHLELHESEPFGLELVLRGARERFTPTLMTALAVALVLVPLVYFGNIAGQEIAYPMAIVILGGLATLLLFSLFIVPSLYLGFGSKKTSPRPKKIKTEPSVALVNGTPAEPRALVLNETPADREELNEIQPAPTDKLNDARRNADAQQ